MLNKLLFVILSLCLLLSCSRDIVVNASLDIIPKPHLLELSSTDADNEAFVLNRKTVVVTVDKTNSFNASYLQSYLKNIIDADFNIVESASSGFVSLNLSDDIDNDEGYRLVVGKNGVEIYGKTEKGVFYGIQTLIQMLPSNIYEKSNSIFLLILPSQNILKYCRFPRALGCAHCRACFARPSLRSHGRRRNQVFFSFF